MVTGAGGFVAGSIVRQAGPEWEVHAISRGEALLTREGLFWHRVDVRDAAGLNATVRETQPHAVIHTAALADIDYCDAHRDEAEALNVGVTEQLARLCRETGARMVHLSTDTVFDGTKGNYRETDAPGPVNFYAETKVRAEQIVSATLPNAVIARLSLVVGFPVLGTGNSFLAKLVPALEAGHEVGAPDDEFRTPIDVITLGRALLELAGSRVPGIIHLAGNDWMSRFEIVQRIARRMGFPEGLVLPRSATGAPGRAPRPRDVSLYNAKARGTLRTRMLGFDAGLDVILDARKGLLP